MAAQPGFVRGGSSVISGAGAPTARHAWLTSSDSAALSHPTAVPATKPSRSSRNVVTNQHVVAGGGSIQVKLWNGKTYKATLVGTDSSTDLAVVKVDAPSSVLHPVVLGNSKDGARVRGASAGTVGTVSRPCANGGYRVMAQKRIAASAMPWAHATRSATGTCSSTVWARWMSPGP